MKKILYLFRTYSALMFVVVWFILALITFFLIRNNFLDLKNTIFSTFVSVTFLTFLYKLLKNIETENVANLKKKIKVIETQTAQEFEIELNKVFSKLADDGYRIYDVIIFEANRAHILYYAKFKE